MNFTQLKYFNAICTYKTVSAAAEFLFVSQPTISSAIKDLEEEFGVILFKRQYRSMVLTQEGELLYDMSRDLISRVEQIERIMNDVGRNRKSLRLGVPPMIGSIFLPHIYQEFNTENPSLKLELFEGGKSELISKLNNNYLDMIFLPHDGPLDTSFSVQHIIKLETMFCVSKEHPLSKLKTITPLDLTQMPLVLFKDSFFQTETIKKIFCKYGVNPKILLQTEQLSNVFRMIENNTAAGFLFKPLTEGNSALAAIPMQEPLYVDISLIWKKDTYLSGSMKSFAAYINKHMQSGAYKYYV